VTTYTWDGENRLTALALPGGSVITNTYGSDGLRRNREDGVETAKYLWDGSRILLESDGSDVTQAVYTSSVGAYGDTVSQRRSNATHYHHPDHLGTIWNLSDSSQATSDSYVFDAWGNQLASTGSTVNPFRYVGRLGYYAEPTTAGRPQADAVPGSAGLRPAWMPLGRLVGLEPGAERPGRGE